MDFLNTYKASFDSYLQENSFHRAPQGLYDPVNYILSLGGKRIRPLLLLMTADKLSGRFEHALDAAYAVELFHNFTLLHDDIMDEAPLRRGCKTVHEQYNVNQAILSGDAMMILAYQYLMKSKKIELLEVFSKMALEVCDGQQMDIAFEEQDGVTIVEYIEMIRLKTSVLIGAAMEMGALLGGATKQSAQHMYNYGVNIGIAFQIQDDLLDTYGTPKVGKQKCGDIIQNKKTYLFLKARENASHIEKLELDELYSSSPDDPSDKINRVLEIYKSTNVIGYSEELKLVYKDLAMSHLVAANLSEVAQNDFKVFGEYLLSREK